MNIQPINEKFKKKEKEINRLAIHMNFLVHKIANFILVLLSA